MKAENQSLEFIRDIRFENDDYFDQKKKCSANWTS